MKKIMDDKLYFAGSIYKEIKRGAGVKECIQRASSLDGHLMTTYNGQPALVSGGRLYVFTGKMPGFKSPWCENNHHQGAE